MSTPDIHLAGSQDAQRACSELKSNSRGEAKMTDFEHAGSVYISGRKQERGLLFPSQTSESPRSDVNIPSTLLPLEHESLNRTQDTAFEMLLYVVLKVVQAIPSSLFTGPEDSLKIYIARQVGVTCVGLVSPVHVLTVTSG